MELSGGTAALHFILLDVHRKIFYKPPIRSLYVTAINREISYIVLDQSDVFV